MDVTMDADWMDQSADGSFLPDDQMAGVSSLFALIAPQGTMVFTHCCLLETGGCASVHTWKNVSKIIHPFNLPQREPFFNSFVAFN